MPKSVCSQTEIIWVYNVQVMKKLLLVLALVGVLDAGYLVYEHYSNFIPPCPAHGTWIVDCGAVLRSQYSEIFGIPLALLGLLHYALLTIWVSFVPKKWAKYLALLESCAGAVFSIYLVYLQLGVVHAICLYCMVSALVSFIIFGFAIKFFSEQRQKIVIRIGNIIYQNLLKKCLFLLDPEFVHVAIARLGEAMWWMPRGLRAKIPELSQNILGIDFELPIGLAAGFDYEGRLTRSLADLGFGFQSIGTITNEPWIGNAKPRLGRLPKSKSLMVNKGFRNPGSKVIISKIKDQRFQIPVGISIGDAQGEVKEIIAAFKKFEQVKNSYFELNISCPNLLHAKELDLDKLFLSVDKLKISKPIFVKMPINKTDKEFLDLLKLSAKHKFAGVIIGNLQKDRTDKSLDAQEVTQFSVGNFSGKPTFERSNHLIKLAYKSFKKRFVIIGCGGVFSAADAYVKIKNGASLVQLITGMIYQGPFLIADINFGLKELLEKDGYKNVSEAVGIDAR